MQHQENLPIGTAESKTGLIRKNSEMKWVFVD